MQRSGKSLEQTDDAHGCGFGVGGDIGPGVDGVACVTVVSKRVEHHLLVGKGGLPVELTAEFLCVEDEALGDHAVVIRPERREIEFVRKLHDRNRGCFGE